MFRVEPVTHEWFAGRAFALRDLVLVMWKCQVNSSSVNVQRLAQILHSHRRAFNVPPGTPRADGGLPKMFSKFRRLPQRKIARAFFFVAVVVHARARLNPRQIDLRELSVLGKLSDA